MRRSPQPQGPQPRRARRGILAALPLLALLSLGAPATAFAQSPEEIQLARQTAVDGLGAYKAGEFEKALELFQQAGAVYPSAQILRMAGYSHLALRHWLKAADAMERALESTVGPLEEGDRKDVQEQLAKATAHIGTVSLTSSVEGTTLVLDRGAPQPLPLEKPLRLVEGPHHFVVSAEEHDDAELEVRIEGGKAVDLSLDPKPKAPPPPPPPPPKPKPKPPPPPPPPKGLFPHQLEVGYAAAGTGVALGGVALITALVGADLRSNVEEDVALHQAGFGENCERGGYRLCVYDRALINHDADRADTLRDTAVVTGIVGAALFAGGATLVVLAPDGPFAGLFSPAKPPRDTAAGARVACGPLGAGLACKGSF